MTLMEGLLWLTLNVYHEGRGESIKGQKAIIYVTLNRTKTRKMSVKEVVLEPYQFSWTLKAQDEWIPVDTKAFVKCAEIVYKAIQEDDFTGGATYFHNSYVNPSWADRMKYVGKFGSQLFYKKNG